MNLSSPDPKSQLAKRLAAEASIPEEQAEKVLEALLHLLAKELGTSSSLGLLLSALVPELTAADTITLDLHEEPDGTMKVHLPTEIS